MLPFLPVCCRDRDERVSAVRTIQMLCSIRVSGRYKKAPQGFSPWCYLLKSTVYHVPLISF
ncbi:hypothetical protein HII03_004881 [Escherichia coli]|nr:hypothetical protein [Escherichia coli]EFJ1158370.1 hypothetical protein [Escherichia coli]RNJ10295.1 hypothetical protein EFV06_25330 [Escherichia coli]TJR32964.1 hypothetical protein C9Z42_24370 [Escherichia coli]